MSLRVGKDSPIDTYLATVSVKNNSSGKKLDVPVKIKVLPMVNYTKPVISSITTAPSNPYDYYSQQVNVTINGSGFNFNPTNKSNDPVYTGTIYRSLNFRDSKGIVTDQITLPSNNPLVNASWTDTTIQKKFLNRVTFLKAYVEVYFYSSSGKVVIATSNVERVF